MRIIEKAKSDRDFETGQHLMLFLNAEEVNRKVLEKWQFYFV